MGKRFSFVYVNYIKKIKKPLVKTRGFFFDFFVVLLVKSLIGYS